MRIIGLVGRRGVGKNFVADRIEEAVGRKHIEKAAFADPIKRFAIDVLGLDEKLVYGNDLDKSHCTHYKWEDMPAYLFAGPIQKNRDRNKGEYLTIRDILQIVGTEFGRDIWGGDIWIRAMENRLNKSKASIFLITDVRFPNEAEAIRKWGGKIWRVEGPQRGSPGASKDPHPSEALADGIEADATVLNEYGTTASLMRKLVKSLLQLYGQFRLWGK